jgi:hypothetical protein
LISTIPKPIRIVAVFYRRSEHGWTNSLTVASSIPSGTSMRNYLTTIHGGVIVQELERIIKAGV